MRELFSLILRMIRPFTVLRWVAYIGVAAVVWVIFDFSLLQQYIEARERRNQYKEQLGLVQKRQDALKLENDALKTGGFPAEKAARERFNFVRQGEKVLTIVTPEAHTTRPLPKSLN